MKVLIDLFIGEVPSRRVHGLRVVEPSYLLTLYETTHSSKNCVAVKSATRLVKNGIDPVGCKELTEFGE